MRFISTSQKKFTATALCTVSALALAAFSTPHAAFAQTPAPAQSAQEDLGEVIVTGSRIIREGYEAPTPLAVVDAAAIEASPTSNVADFVNTMPVFSGSATPATTQSSISAGTAGVNTLNLRSLGANRTLVLLDGQRSVGSTLTGNVDINTFPQQLIQRVEVVTGGASAVYGSDAVSGVANFVLDKQYTGVKGEISGGVTSYGDGKNYKIALSAGFGFGGGRGHVLLSGEQVDRSEIRSSANRDWDLQGVGMMLNPLYGTNAALGQSTSVPQRLVLDHVGQSNATHGGIIVSGPLKGTAFGPGGVPYQHNYGDLTVDPKQHGGDWYSTIVAPFRGNSLDPGESRQNFFTRVAYDITDNINIYGQAAWARGKTEDQCCTQFQQGNAGTIKADNAFIPADIRARMTALALTSFAIGSMQYDLPSFGADSDRTVNRYVLGASGKFDAFGTGWAWDAYFQNGKNRNSVNAYDVASRSKYTLAIDAVRDANGRIVCRSTLTNPTNGCVPYNPLGIGVNTDAALTYLVGDSHLNQDLIQNVWAGSVSGEPFSIWAGPVSLAVSLEHRTEKTFGVSDAGSMATDWFAGNYKPITGSFNVTEGALETVVPLAKGESWAEAWDLNAAARFTGYSTSGFVVTWKAGTTYTPIPDIKLRVTRSRDIRAPNMQELYAVGTSSQGNNFDPFTNTSPLIRGVGIGNTTLKPEKADTTGVGVVLQPRFAPGFSFSADYWTIHVKDAIQSVSIDNVLNLCFQGNTSFCPLITRVNNVVTQVTTYPANLAVQITRGIDFEGSYRFAMDDVVSGWAGNMGLHAQATKYIKNYTDQGIPNSIKTETVGENPAGNPPNWRLTGTLAYDLDPFKTSLTARVVSSGTYNNSYIECSTGCPVSTVANTTINNNHLPGAFYHDAAISYTFGIGEDASGEAFLNVKNIANKDPAAYAPFANDYYLHASNAGKYDVLGRVFRAGVRFKM